MIAHEDDVFGGAISESVIGIVFLGTPHRGSNLANLASVIGNILNVNSIAMRPAVMKTSDLKLLTNNSGPLLDLALSVRHRLQNIMVVSFYETEPTPPLNVLVCDGFFINFAGLNIQMDSSLSPGALLHPLWPPYYIRQSSTYFSAWKAKYFPPIITIVIPRGKLTKLPASRLSIGLHLC